MRDIDDHSSDLRPATAAGGGDRRPLEGTGALVTGGAGGIASASAARLAGDGAVVVLMGRTEATLAATVAEIRAAVPGAEVHHVVGDALREADVAAAVDDVVARAGALGVTVATVGGGVVAPLLARTGDDLVDELRRNLVSPFLAIKHSVPAMAAGGGSIVCISSDAATLSFRHMVGYCSAKAGVDAMVRVAADELGHLGIRVNAVRPGLTRTKSGNIDRIFDDADLIREFERVKPLGRTGVPVDVADAVRFLAGPASAWITGACLPVDGGNSLRMAPDMEAVARRRLGNPVVDAALAGQLPPGEGAGAGPGRP